MWSVPEGWRTSPGLYMCLPKPECEEEHKHNQRFSEVTNDVGCPEVWGYYEVCAVCAVMRVADSSASEDPGLFTRWVSSIKGVQLSFLSEMGETNHSQKGKGQIYLLQQECVTRSCWCCHGTQNTTHPLNSCLIEIPVAGRWLALDRKVTSLVKGGNL